MIITSEITLPYGEYKDIPKTLIVRNANAMEWKNVVSASSETYRYSALRKLLDQTPEYTEKWDLKNLAPIDAQAILIEVRKLTFTPIFKFSYKCTHCGLENQVVLDLNDISYVNTKPELTLELKKTKLKDEKVTLTFKMLTDGDVINAKRDARERISSLKLKDPTYDVSFAEKLHEILVINSVHKIGEDLSNYDVFMLKLGRDLHPIDLRLIEKKYMEVSSSITVSTTKFNCTGCSKEVDAIIPFSYEFLYPEYDD